MYILLHNKVQVGPRFVDKESLMVWAYNTGYLVTLTQGRKVFTKGCEIYQSVELNTSTFRVN